MASKGTTSNIRKIRKPLNINIGMIIFASIFIYVVACIFMSFQTKKIAPYEEKEGSLVTNYTYKGLALREETVVYADRAGYVNFYVRESGRTASRELVYTVDETGKLNEYLKNVAYEETALTDIELNEMRDEIVDFMHEFKISNFSTLYDFKYSMKNVVLKMANDLLIDKLSGTSLRILGMLYLSNMQWILGLLRIGQMVWKRSPPI